MNAKDNVTAANAQRILGAFGGGRTTDVMAKLRTINENTKQIRIAQQLLPRTPEQQAIIKDRARLLAAIMTAKFQVNRDAYLSTESGLVHFIQIAPAFGEGTHGRLPSGTEWWRLCDVRLRVAEMIANPLWTPASATTIPKIIPNPDPTKFVRMGFSINKSKSYTAPAWTVTIRPRSVSKEYAEATALWLPKDTTEVRDEANAQTDYQKRREIWASVWAPYTDIVGHIVTSCMEMMDQNMSQVFWMRQMARTPQEENELLTPIQGFNGDEVYINEITPKLDQMVKETEEKLAEMVTQIEQAAAEGDTANAYDPVTEKEPT